MPLCQAKIRLGARRNFDKGDVETVYGAVVQAIGGTFYTNGVPVGPSNGTLDYRNFSPDLGLTNSYKSAPYATFSVTCDFGNSLNASGFFYSAAALPWEGIGITPLPSDTLLAMVGFNFILRDPSAAANAGTIQPTVWRRGAQTFPFSAQAWSNVPMNRATIMCNVTGFTYPMQNRDVIAMLANPTTGGVSYGHAIATVYFKAIHVRT